MKRNKRSQLLTAENDGEYPYFKVKLPPRILRSLLALLAKLLACVAVASQSPTCEFHGQAIRHVAAACVGSSDALASPRRVRSRTTSPRRGSGQAASYRPRRFDFALPAFAGLAIGAVRTIARIAWRSDAGSDGQAAVIRAKSGPYCDGTALTPRSAVSFDDSAVCVPIANPPSWVRLPPAPFVASVRTGRHNFARRFQLSIVGRFAFRQRSIAR
jgi:hypothetical protein